VKGTFLRAATGMVQGTGEGEDMNPCLLAPRWTQIAACLCVCRGSCAKIVEIG